MKADKPERVLHPKGRREENGTKNGEEPAEDLAHLAETPLRADRIAVAGFNCGWVLLVRRLFPVALLVDEDSGVSTEPLSAVISPAVVVPGADSAAAAAADSSSLGAKWAGFLLRRGFSLFVSSACDPAAQFPCRSPSSVSSLASARNRDSLTGQESRQTDSLILFAARFLRSLPEWKDWMTKARRLRWKGPSASRYTQEWVPHFKNSSLTGMIRGAKCWQSSGSKATATKSRGSGWRAAALAHFDADATTFPARSSTTESAHRAASSESCHHNVTVRPAFVSSWSAADTARM